MITLYQPWASWIMWGWKKIETRKHQRFKCLAGRRIAIHAALAFQVEAYYDAHKYLTDEQLTTSKRYTHPRGAILGLATVREFRPLNREDSRAALIDCYPEYAGQKYGLVLGNIDYWTLPIAAKGGRGIRYISLAEGGA